LDDAIAEFKTALAELTIESTPIDWAMCNANLARASMHLAERRNDGDLAKSPIEQTKAALDVFRLDGRVPTVDYLEAQLAQASAIAKRLGK